MGILKTKKADNNYIPSVKYDKMLLTKNHDRSTYTEYEDIAKNLAFGINLKTCKTIMITSAKHGCGKSVIATNLAVVFAKANYKVLLVDNEFTDPVLHTYFGINGTAGLADYICNDKSDKVEAIQKTSIENIHLVPVFSPVAATRRIITSEDYKNFILAQKSEYDWIIINAPTTESSDEAFIINDVCDGSVLAVELGKTNTYTVNAIRKKLHDNLIGAIIFDGTDKQTL